MTGGSLVVLWWTLSGLTAMVPGVWSLVRELRSHKPKTKKNSEWLTKVFNKTYFCYTVLNLQVGGFILTIWLPKGEYFIKWECDTKFEADIYFGPQSQRYMNYHFFTYIHFVCVCCC